MGVIEQTFGPLGSTALPHLGVDQVDLLRFGSGGSGVSGGRFGLGLGALVTMCDWTATDAELLARIGALLDALPGYAGGYTLAPTTLAGGNGELEIHYANQLAGKRVAALTVRNSLTGANPVLAYGIVVAGVAPTGYGAQRGAILICGEDGHVYSNMGTPAVPDWEPTGKQN